MFLSPGIFREKKKKRNKIELYKVNLSKVLSLTVLGFFLKGKFLRRT